jgi:hypothetical protein
MAIGDSDLEVITVVEMPGDKQLTLIVDALAAPCLAPCPGKGGKQQSGENRDDCNHREKLD